MQTSTKYAALSQQDQVFWTAALAAINNNPNLRGKVTLDLTATPAPEINAVNVRVALKRRGVTWAGTLTVSREQLDRAYEPGRMMRTTFARLFGRAGLDYDKEAAK